MRRSCAGRELSFVLVCVLAGGVSCAAAVPRHVDPASLPANTRELFTQSMELGTHFWDDSATLLRNPSAGSNPKESGHYLVRESSWYALGLLLRDASGDRQRAAAILNVVLAQQYVTPGVKWYGTYRRSPEEPAPNRASKPFDGYDPNWRMFIGTTFAIILAEYPDRIPPELGQRMLVAIGRSIEGEIAEKRLVPSYSNIALMYGFLWDFAAQHLHRADWQQQSADWNESVYRLFTRYNAFFEYNSPTYCGVDLYGLALWRDYGSTQRMQAIGSEMEAALWRDLAGFYQPALRNISGPYDRSYGMDMESYVSVVGGWMRTALNANLAPLPPLMPDTDHLADIWFAPHLAVLGTRIPADALEKMQRFAGPHLVRKQITDQRVATAWIGDHVIFGGESTGKTKDAGPTSQFHPATVQWRTPSGHIGWVQLVRSPMVDATADEHGLTISATGTLRWRIHAIGLTAASIAAGGWTLPGLGVQVTTDARSFRIKIAKDAGNGSFDLVYSGLTTMRLDIQPAP